MATSGRGVPTAGSGCSACAACKAGAAAAEQPTCATCGRLYLRANLSCQLLRVPQPCKGAQPDSNSMSEVASMRAHVRPMFRHMSAGPGGWRSQQAPGLPAGGGHLVDKWLPAMPRTRHVQVGFVAAQRLHARGAAQQGAVHLGHRGAGAREAGLAMRLPEHNIRHEQNFGRVGQRVGNPPSR